MCRSPGTVVVHPEVIPPLSCMAGAAVSNSVHVTLLGTLSL